MKRLANFGQLTSATFDVHCGMEITSTIQEAIKFSAENGYEFDHGASVTFKFNGVEVTVKSDSDETLIYRDWCRALDGCITKQVGPYPKLHLSSRETAHDSRVRDAADVRRSRLYSQRRAQDTAQRDRVVAKLAKIQLMEFSDFGAWNSFVLSNGKDFMLYPRYWARLMQAEIANGKTVGEAADVAMHELGFMNISGSMHGFYVAVLAKCWKYGEELRRWHNKEWGGDENTKGVIDPSVIVLARA